MIDFSEQNLDDMDFGRIDLSGSIFNKSSLKRAKFIGGTYRDSLFEELQPDALEDTEFSFSDFSGARIVDYDGAQSVPFMSSDLHGALFSEVHAPLSLQGCNSNTLTLHDGFGTLTIQDGSHDEIKIDQGVHDDSVFEETTVKLYLSQTVMRRAVFSNSNYSIEFSDGNIEGLVLDQSKGKLVTKNDYFFRNLTVEGGQLNLLAKSLYNFEFRDQCWIRFSRPTRSFEKGKMKLGKYVFLNNEIYFEGVKCENADLLGKGVQFLNFTQVEVLKSIFVRFSIADGTTFYNCDFKDVEFYKCDLGSASFINCRFTNVDFFTSKTSNITLTRCIRNGVRGL